MLLFFDADGELRLNLSHQQITVGGVLRHSGSDA
jgi:hypothetical protein